MLLSEKIGWHDLLPYGPHRFATNPPAADPDPWRGIRSRQTLKTLSASREGWTERKGEEEAEE